jgi:hypothetical protein
MQAMKIQSIECAIDCAAGLGIPASCCAIAREINEAVFPVSLASIRNRINQMSGVISESVSSIVSEQSEINLKLASRSSRISFSFRRTYLTMAQRC